MRGLPRYQRLGMAGAIEQQIGTEIFRDIVGDGQSNGKYVTAAIRPKESYDVREEVARTVIQHGWPLREIRLEHATLEEFFVQVTASQAMGKAAAAEEQGA